MKELKQCTTATIGEAISPETGRKMIIDYGAENSGRLRSQQIGAEILRQIMAQPDCQGIRFYNALNEQGKPTLVYTGVGAQDQVINRYPVVGGDGAIMSVPGIIGDRLRPGTRITADDDDSFLRWIFPF